MLKFDEQVSALERVLRELITLWERYFAGDLRVPPVAERTAMERRLRQLSERPGAVRPAESFRLEQLQHRFMTYAQNWERMLREREEGRGRSIGALRAAKVAQAASQPAAANAAPSASVHSAGNEELFDSYRRAKESLGQRSGLDRATFERQIESQRASLEARLGRMVHFDVKVADGKVKLVVRNARGGKQE